MPITVVTKVTRPKGTPGFAAFSAENAALQASLNEWTASLPGFISQTELAAEESLDSNTNVVSFTTVWDNIGDYMNYLTFRATRPEQVIRYSYNESNGIMSETTETVS
jgi:hypothetical protein